MIAVVVVTWNSEDVIGRCLDSCLRTGGLSVVVVDNASSDRTVQEISSRASVRLVANRENRGFAAACNQGIAACSEPTVLLLNPDAILEGGIEDLALEASRPGVGAAAGRLLNTFGQDQHGFSIRALPAPITLMFEVLGLNRLLPFNPVNRRYRLRSLQGPADVEQPAGAFLMLNRAAWQAIGGLDESFWPAWFEDVDLCARLRRHGYRIRYVPSATARHVGGHAAGKLSWADRQLFWYNNLLRYAGKHYSTTGRRGVAGAVMAASVLRSLFTALTGKQHVRGTYTKVFLQGWECWRKNRVNSYLRR